MKTIQLQLSVTIGDDAARILAEIIGPAIKHAQRPAHSDVDERREARLRASQNALFAGQKPPEDQGMLIDSREATPGSNLSRWKNERHATNIGVCHSPINKRVPACVYTDVRQFSSHHERRILF